MHIVAQQVIVFGHGSCIDDAMFSYGGTGVDHGMGHHDGALTQLCVGGYRGPGMDNGGPADSHFFGQHAANAVAADGDQKRMILKFRPCGGDTQNRHAQDLGPGGDAVIENAENLAAGGTDAVNDHLRVAAAADQYDGFRHGPSPFLP